MKRFVFQIVSFKDPPSEAR